MIQQILFSILLWQQPASFIDQSVASANEAIAKEPNRPDGYNDLALAMVRKLRETGDSSFVDRAEEAMNKSLKLMPANFNGRLARVAVRLVEHRFEDALEEADALRKLRPDENLLYSYISEAQIGLGNYPEAEKSVQRMLDLRSVNVPGFETGAIVRELIGFPDAAIDWWQSALHLVSDRDGEERAHIFVQMARIYRETGKFDQGAESAQSALQLVPKYPAAILELARIRIDREQPQGAIELLKERTVHSKDLASLYWLALARERAGDPAAASSWSEFEKSARAARQLPMNENALLVRYLAEHGKAAEAAAIAKESLERRHDLFIRQAYAIALSRSGRTAEAYEQIQKALQPGFQDAELFFDAGTIAEQQKDFTAANNYYKKAFQMSSGGARAKEILDKLQLLNRQSPS